MDELRQKLIWAVFLLVFVFSFGIVGYAVIERWSIFDSVYMTVITLASVGYGETNPLSPNGRIFTMILIVCGMGTFVYGITTVTAFFVEGELKGYLRRKQMKAKIDRLSNHYIVCGAECVGRHIIDEFLKTKREFVVIDSDEANIDKIRHRENILYYVGDPASDEVLEECGVKRARGLISALPSDKDNLFVVITARSLNPDMRIVTQVVEEGSFAKLKKAGADALVSTDTIGALRIASEMVRPTVVSFLDKMLRSTDSALRVEEIDLTSKSSIVGMTLREADVTDTTGLGVLSIFKKETGLYIYNPKSSYKVEGNDILVCIGNPEQIAAFKRKFSVEK